MFYEEAQEYIDRILAKHSELILDKQMVESQLSHCESYLSSCSQASTKLMEELNLYKGYAKAYKTQHDELRADAVELANEYYETRAELADAEGILDIYYLHQERLNRRLSMLPALAALIENLMVTDELNVDETAQWFTDVIEEMYQVGEEDS